MADIRLADLFVELADTLIGDFDVIDFLYLLAERCVQLLGVSAAGILLTEGQDSLQLVAASSEPVRLLELFQLQTGQGPCVECFHTGQPVSVADLPTAGRWPRFTQAAAEVGLAAVHAVPMRARGEAIGALNLFNAAPGALDDDTCHIGQALADVATIGLLQQREIRRHNALTTQLQTALNSRIIIEQAKGVIAERRRLDMDQSFTLLRATARATNRRLADLAEAVVNGSEPLPDRSATPSPSDQETRP